MQSFITNSDIGVCVDVLRKAACISASFDCQDCPAYNVCPTGTAGWNNECIFKTSADAIESLLERLRSVESQLNAAIKDMHDIARTGDNPLCRWCTAETCDTDCDFCSDNERFEWRGVKE